MAYAIQVTDVNKGEGFLLLTEDNADFQRFDTFEEADDFNYEFEQTLEDGLSSAVVEFN
ncbi:hypothetical protein [Paenibacillus xylanexedens]|uniref:hypothetical protein n=1 Tax=Paenibacillus xylanexedens TaxID=528191 RepID=UPI0016433E08|nr:hypothetical protein [Paenibacillus xylanexedens]